MAYDDLRSFVKALEKNNELKRIKAEVDCELEITEITDRVSKQGGPALLEERPGQSLTRELTILDCQGGAIGFLRLGPAGEICIGVAHLLLNRRVVLVRAGDRFDDLLKERLVLIRHGQADGCGQYHRAGDPQRHTVLAFRAVTRILSS